MHRNFHFFCLFSTIVFLFFFGSCGGKNGQSFSSDGSSGKDQLAFPQCVDLNKSKTPIEINHSPLVSNHQIPVKFLPNPEIIRQPIVVSFAFPLPSSVLFDTKKVRVLDPQGEEVEAYVESLGDWKNKPPVELTCKFLSTSEAPGIRSLLIQFSYNFQDSIPLTFTIQLQEERKKDLLEKTVFEKTLRVVTEEKCSSEPIYEPQVYALLPPSWLSCSNLTTLSTVAETSSLMQKTDEGQIHFFDTVINNFNPNPKEQYLIDFYTVDEHWLFDRAQVFYNGYFRTGRSDFLREAYRAVQLYIPLLYKNGDCVNTPLQVPDEWCRGFFKLKNPPNRYYKDSKYSYNESLVTHYWLSGDSKPLARLSDISSATQIETPVVQPIDPKYFSERHQANSLLALVMQYEIVGSNELKNQIFNGVTQLKQMQDNPENGNPKNGCFNNHPDSISDIGFSPWMSSLLAHALLRTYHNTNDSRIPLMMVDLAKCVRDRALYLTNEEGFAGMLVPFYIASSFGPLLEFENPDHEPLDSNREHALDVAYILALGSYFSQSSTDKNSLSEAARGLLKTHELNLQYWTRPEEWPQNGRAIYRVDPPRKYSWWYKNAGAIGWALEGRKSLSQ